MAKVVGTTMVTTGEVTITMVMMADLMMDDDGDDGGSDDGDDGDDGG